jgi:hypothetical protein
MIENDEQKPSLDFLAHHGVQGMKWGVRKAAPITPVRSADVKRYGSSGAKRIARNRDKGLTVKQAQKKEVNRTRLEVSAALGAIIVGQLLAAHGGSISETIAKKADANRARNSVTALSKNAAKVNYAKKNLGGAYKIHSM